MAWFDHLLTTFYTAKWQVTADQAIYYREIAGNALWLRLSRAEAGRRLGTPAPATA